MERFESGSAGRAVISAVIVVLVASVAISSLIDSPLKRSLLRHDQVLLDATGLDQRWNLFAPDPRRRDIDVRARLRYAGGVTETLTLPSRGRLLGSYSDHRWRKWMDNAARHGPTSSLWPWLADWLASTRRSGGRRPLSVTVTGRWRDLRPPGADGPDRGPWRQLVLYRLQPR
jgi:hypothetical protein